MPIDLNRFTSIFNNVPPARESDYEIIISGPAGIGDPDLTYRADSVQLPGRSIATTEQVYIGPQRKVAYAALYLETSITFIESDDYRVKEYFDRWLDKVVGTHRINRTVSDGSRFRSGYYDDYIGTIDIHNLRRTGAKGYNTKLIEAYPIQVAPVSLSWASDAIPRINVTFTYRYYEQNAAGSTSTANLST